MRIFSKRSHSSTETFNQQSRRAVALAAAISRRQQQIATSLSTRFERLPLHLRKCCLLSFCLLLGGASGWLLVEAVLLGDSRQAATAFSKTRSLPGLPPKKAELSQPAFPSQRQPPDSLPTDAAYPSILK